MKLYAELADWWPLLSPPAEYADEAPVYARLLRDACPTAATLLELGSGGGSNACYLKRQFAMTLTDRAPAMLAVRRRLNPELEHVAGDMRTLRLGRQFDAVFVHDAVCYLTSAADLRQAMDTAFAHCRPGGAALFAPDFVRETFRPGTACGGRDGGGRGLRYLEWTWDPDPADSTYLVDFAYLLREADGSVRVEPDRHVEGLFARAEWLALLAAAGFAPRRLTVDFDDGLSGELFVGVRPG